MFNMFIMNYNSLRCQNIPITIYVLINILIIFIFINIFILYLEVRRKKLLSFITTYYMYSFILK